MKTNFLYRMFRTTSATTLLAVGAATFSIGTVGVVQAEEETNMSRQEYNGEVLDDKTIVSKVKTALGQDENVRMSASSINVTSRKGIVQLSGYADSSQKASRAAEIARTVSGVREVENNIRSTADLQ